MAYQQPMQKASRPTGAHGLALTIVRMTAGTYLFFMGLGKVGWLLDSAPLTHQLAEWSLQSTAISHWYLERVAPGAPMFARLVPLAEMAGGAALVVGFWTRIAAALLLFAALNFQLASGVILHYAYLRNANGLPLLGALLALAIGGARLPLSLRK